jgi:hypothetical protein
MAESPPPAESARTKSADRPEKRASRPKGCAAESEEALGQARQRAARLAEMLRQLGRDPDQL